MLLLASHNKYTEGTDRQKDGRQTVTLRFPLDVVSVTTTLRVFTPLQCTMHQKQRHMKRCYRKQITRRQQYASAVQPLHENLRLIRFAVDKVTLLQNEYGYKPLMEKKTRT